MSAANAVAAELDLVVTRLIDAPRPLVFKAWTTPALLMRWWAPKAAGLTLVSCAVDARTGGSYRFEIKHTSAPEPMAFFGKYLEVIPNARLVWTNEEGPDGPVTTVTFAEKDGQTLVTLSELYPTKAALDAAVEGMGGGGMMPEQFDQLDAVLIEMGAGGA